MNTRKVKSRWSSTPTVEGAGVKLQRVFGGREIPRLDPFLLLDDFGSSKPEDYLAGFPWHPHRGIETVTYMLDGIVNHEDSMGNKGAIKGGEIQWMTAGSGIIHQEMPEAYTGTMRGFQLWVNLPKKDKMSAPRYQDVTKNGVPEIVHGNAKIKIICGKLDGVSGPVSDLYAESQYLDIAVPPRVTLVHPVKAGHTVFAYVFEGSGIFDLNEYVVTPKGSFVHYADDLSAQAGESVAIKAESAGVRFLLISGKPIGEPVAWYGPIVMNTKAELLQAFEELQTGEFIKKVDRAPHFSQTRLRLLSQNYSWRYGECIQ